MKSKLIDNLLKNISKKESEVEERIRNMGTSMLPYAWININSPDQQIRLTSLKFLESFADDLATVRFIYDTARINFSDSEKFEFLISLSINSIREEMIIDYLHFMYEVFCDISEAYYKTKVVDLITTATRNLIRNNEKTELFVLFFELGMKFFQKGDYFKAVWCLDLSILYNPLFEESYSHRGLCLYNLGKYEESIRDYSKALELEPETSSYYVNRGDSYYRLGRYPEALQDFDNAIRVNPQNLKAYFNRGLTYSCMENYEKAIEDFSKVIELKPEFVEAYISRGMAYEFSNDKKRALENYKMALSIDKNNPEAIRRLENLKSKEEEAHLIDANMFIERPDLKLSMVVGQDEAKELLKKNILYPIKYPEMAKQYKIKAMNVLLYGPPGCGKTLIVRAIAGEANIPLYYLDMTIQDLYVGNSEKNVKRIFEDAKINAPSIIFLDEVDALCMNRMEHQQMHDRKMISEILIDLSRLEATNDPERPVVVVAATNNPWDVDMAIKRAGRIGKEIYITPPSFDERVNYFKMLLINTENREEIDYNLLAEKTCDFSFALIKQVVYETLLDGFAYAIETRDDKKIRTEDIISTISRYKPDLINWKDRFKDYSNNQFKTIGF